MAGYSVQNVQLWVEMFRVDTIEKFDIFVHNDHDFITNFLKNFDNLQFLCFLSITIVDRSMFI